MDIVPPLHLSPNEVKFYREEGYLLLPGLVGESEAGTLKNEVMDIMAAIGLSEGAKLKQSHEYLIGSALDRFVNSANLLSVASQLMEGPATLYLPFTAVKSTGGGQFHFHQDNQYTRFDGPGINLWMALSPMTPENGCLMVVPRSHLKGTLPSFSPDNDGHKAVTFDPDQFLPIRMRAGDLVAFSRLTVHGSGPNTTSDPRVAYATQFHRDDVNYSLDQGETWKELKGNPRWSVAPVATITPPKTKLDGH